jgi:acyl-CoA reductase-like NAD-dependent aldehyde dehydrogenase
MSTERVIVQSAVADRLLNEIQGIVQDLRPGDVVNDSSASLGALFTESSAENVVGMIKDAVKDGATVFLGDVTRQSSMVAPHLVKNVKPGMRLWDRETFGPGAFSPYAFIQCTGLITLLVVVFAVAETVQEAIELANASEYSLSASLWTSNVFEGQRIAGLIRTGRHIVLSYGDCTKHFLSNRLYEHQRSNYSFRSD